MHKNNLIEGMISFTNDENRWANSIGHRIIEERNKTSFNVKTIIEDCEANARDKKLSEPFRECMAHAAQFLKIAVKYDDKSILKLAQMAAYGMMYGNMYDE